MYGLRKGPLTAVTGNWRGASVPQKIINLIKETYQRQCPSWKETNRYVWNNSSGVTFFKILTDYMLSYEDYICHHTCQIQWILLLLEAARNSMDIVRNWLMIPTSLRPLPLYRKQGKQMQEAFKAPGNRSQQSGAHVIDERHRQWV